MTSNINNAKDVFRLFVSGLKKLHESVAFCAPVHRRFEYRVACRIRNRG